jgi:sensor domain CHASE-containing protein
MASLIAYLTAPEAGSITGQVSIIDSGFFVLFSISCFEGLMKVSHSQSLQQEVDDVHHGRRS